MQIPGYCSIIGVRPTSIFKQFRKARGGTPFVKTVKMAMHARLGVAQPLFDTVLPYVTRIPARLPRRQVNRARVPPHVRTQKFHLMYATITWLLIKARRKSEKGNLLEIRC